MLVSVFKKNKIIIRMSLFNKLCHTAHCSCKQSQHQPLKVVLEIYDFLGQVTSVAKLAPNFFPQQCIQLYTFQIYGFSQPWPWPLDWRKKIVTSFKDFRLDRKWLQQPRLPDRPWPNETRFQRYKAFFSSSLKLRQNKLACFALESPCNLGPML